MHDHTAMGLPLRMNNLHAPTVPSGPTTAPATNGGAAHITFAELQRKKDNMEAELKALSSVLDSVRRDAADARYLGCAKSADKEAHSMAST